MRKSRKDADNGGITTALAAVALQDHLVKSLSLDLPDKVRFHSTSKSSLLGKSSTSSHALQQKSVPKRKDNAVEREYVLDRKPPPLTLAQRYGLVEAPKQLLTEDEWKKVKEKAKQRQDFRQPCVICKEELGAQQHVLLSCTHVFHKTCLQSFERFTGRKSCPMCRKEQYQTRIVHDGSACLQEKSATIIQAAWRGYVVKCWYKNLRQTVPPKDVKLRTKFFEEKLKIITDRMVKSIDNDINNFLYEMDQSLEASRDVFQQFDDMFRVIHESDWEHIEKKAKERADVDCPICLMQLHGISEDPYDSHRVADNKSASKAASMNLKKSSTDQCAVSNNRKRRVVLLSCSHAFHQTCLQALEDFTVAQRGFVCPVCRAHYQKKLLTS